MMTADALAASPFGLLDAHSSLCLVTDAVHEDDALCLALTCRALRDALGLRFPACPRAGGRAVAELAARVTTDGVLGTYQVGSTYQVGRIYLGCKPCHSHRDSAGWRICPRPGCGRSSSAATRS